MTAQALVGVSLKMYFGHAEARRWCEKVAQIARTHPAVVDGRIELFVIPGYLQLGPALEAFEGTPVVLGAQDVATEDSGAFTGEVSAAELAEIGVRLAEVGHAERRGYFGETAEVVAAKTAAALRNGLTPVICLGEGERMPTAAASAELVEQLAQLVADAPAGKVIVAYEPVWAIGAPQPAPAEHIASVARALRAAIDADEARHGSSVIYGGSAGPGLIASLDGAVDGLFLGRFAHDPAGLLSVLDETDALLTSRAAVGA